MMKRIRMNCTATLDETFADFLLSRRAKGLQYSVSSFSANSLSFTANRSIPFKIP